MRKFALLSLLSLTVLLAGCIGGTTDDKDGDVDTPGVTDVDTPAEDATAQ